MATKVEYRDFVLEQLAELGEVSCRAMMGEYVLYYRNKVFGGIYDNRLMVKNVPSAQKALPNAAAEPPYPGAKAMIVVDNLEDKTALQALVCGMYEELPMPKPKKRK